MSTDFVNAHPYQVLAIFLGVWIGVTGILGSVSYVMVYHTIPMLPCGATRREEFWHQCKQWFWTIVVAIVIFLLLRWEMEVVFPDLIRNLARNLREEEAKPGQQPPSPVVTLYTKDGQPVIVHQDGGQFHTATSPNP